MRAGIRPFPWNLLSASKTVSSCSCEPDIIVVVPSVDNFGVDFDISTGDNAKVVAGALHGPEKVAM